MTLMDDSNDDAVHQPLLSVVNNSQFIEKDDMIAIKLEPNKAIRNNFILMSILFSANQACVVACVAYASDQLGDILGGYGSGCLFICYALTSCFCAKPIVSMIGPKNGLLVGASGYCIYVLGFLLSLFLPHQRWVVFIAACLVGGLAGGVFWTAQGKYFALSAKIYAQVNGKPLEDVNASFAGLFATYYLGLEMSTKLIATLIFLISPANGVSSSGAAFIVFSLYTCVAILALCFMTQLDSLGEVGTWRFDSLALWQDALGTSLMLVSEPLLMLLVPVQFAFGFTCSFVNYYVFGTIIADSVHLGSSYIGALSALVCFSGAVMAIPAGWVAKAHGKVGLMITGGLCLAAVGAGVLLRSNAQLSDWGPITIYLVIYGVGRGIWENTNKAVVADFFGDSDSGTTAVTAAGATYRSSTSNNSNNCTNIPGSCSGSSSDESDETSSNSHSSHVTDPTTTSSCPPPLSQRQRQQQQCTTAFAAVAFTSGLSKSLGFFIWPSQPRALIGTIIVVVSGLSIVSYLCAVRLFTLQRKIVVDNDGSGDRNISTAETVPLFQECQQRQQHDQLPSQQQRPPREFEPITFAPI